ncbi:MAG: NAD(P)-dependent oxidoreductase, partial [Eubacteriales bacterium]
VSGSEGDINYLPLDEMLSVSDVLSVHCPLNTETHGMIDRNFINKMKDGAYLINTARGAILNEKDTADALISGKLSGAGLDVLAAEPALRTNPLLCAPNTIITPHIGWTTRAARERLMETIEKNLAAFISGNAINIVL